MKNVLLMIVTIVMILGAHSPAAAQSEQKELCKKGQWAEYYLVISEEKPTAIPEKSDQAFKNQGQCIKFVNQGGDLPQIPEGDTTFPTMGVHANALDKQTWIAIEIS